MSSDVRASSDALAIERQFRRARQPLSPRARARAAPGSRADVTRRALPFRENEIFARSAPAS